MTNRLDQTTFPITCSQGHTNEITPPELRAASRPRCKDCGEDVTAQYREMLEVVGRAELAIEAANQKAERP
jgi:hypothetical protein